MLNTDMVMVPREILKRSMDLLGCVGCSPEGAESDVRDAARLQEDIKPYAATQSAADNAALRKALAAPMPEPSDIVMVPREPTPEMIIEGSCAVKPGGFIEDIYAAMIAAAPAPTVSDEYDMADDGGCPVCGEDGGTSCGMPNCGFLQGAAPVVPADQWKAAIDNELICCHIGTTDSFPNAKSALKNLIDWHVSVAIDPAVSSDAQALIDRGAAQPADLTETAHRIENGEITNGHFSHRNLVMCSKEHYAALIDSTLTAQPAVPLTDADIDRIADAVPVDQLGVHITTWHRRFARAVLSATAKANTPIGRAA